MGISMMSDVQAFEVIDQTGKMQKPTSEKLRNNIWGKGRSVRAIWDFLKLCVYGWAL